jgi:digeranylgeranylglycerophospholipid reductase
MVIDGMISVIGAGPAGSYYSSLAAKNSEVHLFEEDKLIGRPVACTGILTDSVRSVLKNIPNNLIVTNINRFKIIAPNGKSIYIDLKKRDIVLDRAAFDQYLYQKAVDSGARIHLNERFLGYKSVGKHYKIMTNKSSYNTDMIVGADGPLSQVAKSANIYGNRKFIQGLQVRAKYPGLEEGTTIIHLNLGEFSWIVPEDDRVARIGVIGVNDRKLHKDYKKLISGAEIIENQSGIIPLYNPRQKLRKGKEEIFLIGDAATQVKATTYGGIIYGLLASSLLAQDKESYVKKFNSKLGRDLWLSLKMRELMNSMTDKQADELIAIFEKESNIKILSEHDRDFPSKFVVKLLMKEAKLWRLGFDIFKNKLTK